MPRFEIRKVKLRADVSPELRQLVTEVGCFQVVASHLVVYLPNLSRHDYRSSDGYLDYTRRAMQP